MQFEDHFSRGAGDYARFRPTHPPALFEYLASVAPGRALAWDCATGNGQAAVALAGRFERVVATDASRDQIAHAVEHERVEYRVEPAEAVSLGDASADLVTVAVAIHWFDFDRFYAEVRRVVRPRGILAAWTYFLPTIEPQIDRLLRRVGTEVLAGYWPPRFRYVENEYRTLPFPLEELDAPRFELEAAWTLDQLLGFVGSWSGTSRFVDATGRQPVEEVRAELRDAWGDPRRRRAIRWPCHLRVGRIG